MTTPSQPDLVSELANAIKTTAYFSDSYPAPPKHCILFYGKEETGTHRLDLATATEADLEKLHKACDKATFGRNKEDVLDESYRKAGKLDLEYFASTFDLPESGILENVSAHLLDGKKENSKIRAELYKLNVYGPGEFFKAHQDTPRAESMFGSLVVVLPSQHTGGALIIRHKGNQWSINSESDSTDPPKITYATFYSDTEHEVEPVTSGYRVTLTYNLHFADTTVERDTAVSLPGNEDMFNRALFALLADDTFLPDGGLLGFGLSHQYALGNHEQEINSVLARLKGGDEVVRKVCEEAGFKVEIRALYRLDNGVVMTTRFEDPDGAGFDNDYDLASWLWVDREACSSKVARITMRLMPKKRTRCTGSFLQQT